mgnify:FL=1
MSTALFCFVVIPSSQNIFTPSFRVHKEQKRRSLSVLVVIIYLIMVFVRSASSSSSSLLSFLLKSTTTRTSRIKRGSETTRKTIQKYYSSSTTFDRSGETISRDMRRKDVAEETRYFAHEDYELLRKLARKAKHSADEVNPEHGQKLRETERRELAKLVPSLRDGDLTKILNWLHKDGTGTRA